jgi:glycosyltransferase involved in cell wall biosynthesis
LVLCHVSAVDAALTAVRRVVPDAPIDMLVYGRSHERVDAGPDVEIVALPDLSGSRMAQARAVAAFVHGVRRRRYIAAYVAQPNLRLSRARGLLLSFPVLAGARRVERLDPGTGTRDGVSRAAALVDAVQWVLLFAAGQAIARVAAAIVGRLASRPGGEPSPLPANGEVLYLRTDIDLAVAPLTAGGSAAHTEGIIQGLERNGFTVDVRSTGAIHGMAGELPFRRLPVVLAGNLPTELAELLSGLRQAITLLREGVRPDLVYQRYSLDNLAGLIVARVRRVPLVLEANASEAQWREEWAALTHPALAHACERLLLTRADRVTTVSDNAAAGLLRAGTPPERLQVIPNGVDVERFADARPARLPWEGDVVVFAFSGLFYPWHGVPVLADAFAQVFAQEPRARLLLVGDGEEMPQVRASLQHCGALDAAHVTGLVPRDQVPGYLAAADVLVSPHAPHPSFVGSPIKIFEYLAAGRPLIVTRVGQMGELLDDGRTARLVVPGDPAALAAAMLELARDHELRARLAAGAAGEAQRHAWDARVATLLEGE